MDSRRTVRLEAWEVLGRWQLSVQISEHDEDGRVTGALHQSATSTIPWLDDGAAQAEAVLARAAHMCHDLGMEDTDLLSGGRRLSHGEGAP